MPRTLLPLAASDDGTIRTWTPDEMQQTQEIRYSGGSVTAMLIDEGNDACVAAMSDFAVRASNRQLPSRPPGTDASSRI